MAHWAGALRDSDGRAVVRAYADQKSCRVSEAGCRRLRVDTPPGEHLFVDFDESGDISGLELPPERQAEPDKYSRLSRVFGGKGG